MATINTSKSPKTSVGSPGRKYGIKANPEEEALEEINREMLVDEDFYCVDDLAEKLQTFKAKYLEFDKDKDGHIDLMGLTRMLEKLGEPKTHLQMKKIIRDVDRTNSGTINYRDFLGMMIGPKSSFLKIIMAFEEKAKEVEKPTGVAPKRDLSSLP